MKSIRVLMTALLAAGIPAWSFGQNFSWEVGASYLTADIDIDDVEVNEDNFALYATYYFDRVDPGARSLREAPYLDRASYISLGADIQELDDEFGSAIDTDAYRASGRFVGRDSGWYVDAAYVEADAETALGSGGARAAVVGYRPAYDGFAVAVGRYLARFTTLQISYSEFGYKGDYFIQAAGRRDSDLIGLGVKHYGALTGTIDFSVEANYRFLDLEARPLDDERFENSGEIFDVAFTLYPTPNFGVGVSYVDSDDLRGAPYLPSITGIEDGLGVFADWFITDRFSLRVLYNNRDYEIDTGIPESPGEVDSDTVLVGLSFRL